MSTWGASSQSWCSWGACVFRFLLLSFCQITLCLQSMAALKEGDHFHMGDSFVLKYEGQFNLKSSFCILCFCGYVRIISFFSYHDLITLYSMALSHVQTSISLLKTSNHHFDSRFLNICLISSTVLLIEPPSHRIQKIVWAGLNTYTRINSHICHSSPFSRVAITWRRKGIDRQPEVRNNGHAPRDPHHWLLAPWVLVNSERRDSCP